MELSQLAIPAVIDSFKFMKRYIPAFAGGAAITTMSGDDAEANPVKAIANAVFKSTVRDAVEQKITIRLRTTNIQYN